MIDYQGLELMGSSYLHARTTSDVANDNDGRAGTRHVGLKVFSFLSPLSPPAKKHRRAYSASSRLPFQ